MEIFRRNSQEGGGLPGGWGCLWGIWAGGGLNIFFSGPKFPPRKLTELRWPDSRESIRRFVRIA